MHRLRRWWPRGGDEPRRPGDRLLLYSDGIVEAALVLLAGLVVAATTLHVLVAVVLREPAAVGLLATATLGVPSAVMSIGLAQGVLDAGQAAAVVSAVLATIAVAAAGGAILSRHAGPAPR
jgi:hypothetical protein